MLRQGLHQERGLLFLAVTAEIDRNRAGPGREFGPGLPVRKHFPGSQKGLLRHVLCLLPVSQQAVGHTPDDWHVAIDQRGLRHPVSGGRPRDLVFLVNG